MSTRVPSLTLTYFDMAGRAEAIRRTLTLAGVSFKDERVSFAQWDSRKTSLPYGKVPVLAADGEILAETQPILRYVGRLTGTYPPATEPIACAMVDEILDSFADLFQRIILPTIQEQDREKSKAMRDELAKDALPQSLTRINTRMEAARKLDFFAKNASRIYIHEVLASGYVEYITQELADHIPVAFMDQFPAMRGCQQKVTAGDATHQQTLLTATTDPIPKPQSVTLSYFDMAGRAEPVRLALHVGGISFKDERVGYLDYLERKPSLPNGNLPVLNVDGHVLAQSATILRYAGTIGGLYPAQNPLLAAKVDEVLSHLSELYYAFDPWFAESDPAKKQALGETLAATTVRDSLLSLDKRVAQWAHGIKASPYALGGDAPTIADISIHALMQFLQTDFAGTDPQTPTTKITREFARLTAISDAIGAHARVVDWYAKQKTPAMA